jgi:hypothetical protein
MKLYIAYMSHGELVVDTTLAACPQHDACSPYDRNRILVVRSIDGIQYLLLIGQHQTCVAERSITLAYTGSFYTAIDTFSALNSYYTTLRGTVNSSWTYNGTFTVP